MIKSPWTAKICSVKRIYKPVFTVMNFFERDLLKTQAGVNDSYASLSPGKDDFKNCTKGKETKYNYPFAPGEKLIQETASRHGVDY